MLVLSTSNGTYSVKYVTQTIVHFYTAGEYLGTAVLHEDGNLTFSCAPVFNDDDVVAPVKNYTLPLTLGHSIRIHDDLHAILDWYEQEAA